MEISAKQWQDIQDIMERKVMMRITLPVSNGIDENTSGASDGTAGFQNEEKAEKIGSFSGIDIYRIPADKFKTSSINFFFNDSLSRENVTLNALIPAVLRRGCNRYKTFRDIALRLEELYGASFDCGVAKKGECHIIQFYMEFISDKFALEDGSLFEKAFDVLFEIVNEPGLEKGVFKEDYLLQEKDNLKKLIEGRMNDKMQYGVERCFEEMCKDEPYGLYEYGYVEDLEKITSAGLYGQYKKMVENYPLQVYLAGDMDEKKIDRVVKKLSTMKRGPVNKLNCCNVDKKAGQVKTVTEKMDVTQGKLTLGFRTSTASGSQDYYSLIVYNGILGGGIHSKLFQNVREKASLAYYAYSRLDRFKGLMVISSGVDMKNKEKAQEIMLEQLEEIKKGNISEYEYESTMKTIETGVKSLMDSQMQIVDYYLSQEISGTGDSFATMAEKVKKVTIQDVVDISGKIQLDTVYFLTGDREA